MAVAADQFRQALGSFASGVTVVTTKDSSGVPYGLTVSAFTSVSLDPPLVLVCLNNRLRSLHSFLESRKFAVNILGADQEETSVHFATKGSERVSWIRGNGETGVPVLETALARLECEVVQTVATGDHTLLVGSVEAVSWPDSPRDPDPLLYFQGSYRRLV